MSPRSAGLVLALAALHLSTVVRAEDGGAPVAGGAVGDGRVVLHETPRQSPVDTALPLYFEQGHGPPFARVILRYMPFGSPRYRTLPMKRMGRGFGVLVPCEDISTTGPFRYYLAFVDEDDEAVGSLGSPEAPFEVAIVNEVAGDRPHLPGQAPPPAHQCLGSAFVGPCPRTEPFPIPAPAPSGPSPAPRKAGGCAGCSAAASTSAPVPLGLVAALALALARRRALLRGRARRTGASTSGRSGRGPIRAPKG